MHAVLQLCVPLRLIVLGYRIAVSGWRGVCECFWLRGAQTAEARLQRPLPSATTSKTCDSVRGSGPKRPVQRFGNREQRRTIASPSVSSVR